MRKIKITAMLIFTAALLAGGCGKSQQDPRVTMGDGVGTAGVTTNPLVRPFAYLVSDLIGQGLVVEQINQRVGKSGFLEVDITLINESYRTKKFQYRFEWLDADGALLDTKATTWLPYSIAGNATSSIRGVSPRTEAVSFRVVTRKAP